ncbi:17374_t:CDS:2 [Gigaspora margarita]|uniref:17374_t:CDS:1 n=1 Tax=Gigaspora margarita TaxID=4874 RepID=A0ABN7VUS8_GIGMA|nr:17374_t:CDS:2 [Gigaspora margarita]
MAEPTTQAVVDQNVLTASANASAAVATATHIQTQQQLLQQQQNQAFMTQFWNKQIMVAEQFESDFKNHPLPLARIKKVMKSDQDVKMISAEAPILFSKACEIFISEITMRAWTHAEENKRRTLQRSDVASAVSRSDQFDFLIDIVPREEVPKSVNRRPKEEPVGMFADQNVLAYYPHQAGITYGQDTTAYYQQFQAEHFQHGIQLQERLNLQRQQFTQRQHLETTQRVTNQEQPHSHSSPLESKLSISMSPSDGSVIDDQLKEAVNMLTSVNVIHSKQQQITSQELENQQSKSSRKESPDQTKK